MKVVPVEDLDTLRLWHAVDALAHDYEALPADPFEDRLPSLDPAKPETGEVSLLRLGLDDGRAVGVLEVTYPTLDNLSSCWLEVRIDPAARRRGFGRELLLAGLEEAAALERPKVFFEVPSPYPSGTGPAEHLAREVGARPVLKEVRRLLDLKAAPPTMPPDAPDGYRLVQWVDRVPEEYVDAMAYLMHRMSTDAPFGDMDWEPEVWDAARYRAKEASSIAKGRSRYATLVVHVETGRVVGFTDIGVSRHRTDVAYQWETIVETAHRGHGLGLVLKAHNHWLLADRSPQTQWLNTWNAESNTHMVAINESLGFEPMEYWTEWQLDR